MTQYAILTSVLSVSAIVMLSACGGNSDGGDTGASIGKRLTVDLMSEATQCNFTQPLAGADIIVHRQDGSILSQSKSPSNGKVDILWPADAKHISIAVDIDGEMQVNTHTEMTGGDLGINTFWQSSLDSQCECETFNFDLSDVNTVYSGYTALFERSENTSRLLCKNDGKFAPVHVTLMPQQPGVIAYSAILDINGHDSSQPFTVLSSQFDSAKNEGTLLSVIVNPYEPNVTRYTTFSETESGRVNWLTWTKGPQVFPALLDNNFISVSASESLGGNEFGDLHYQSGIRKKVINANVQQDLNLPQDQYQMLAETQAILDGMLNGGGASYNFTNIGSGNILLAVDLFEYGAARWYIEAPLSGMMPELSLPANIESRFEQLTQPRMTVSIYGYQNHASNQYQEFRQQRAGKIRENSAVRSSFFDKYTYQLIDINLNLN
ncbi:hypothetical protein [Shewanella sp. OMA3-2]|uniref:hypothetical protein n=1 Tax=Shewanella sp. OMA3-2 TaxID=2908650 RepID=UPI001F2DE21A|nr:hypothetical protein [Shewanella sp. OMA3-2]UJF22156.1 hypothetical protein L0B17_01510 [Shewanella sp. OMA3-2]